MSTYSILTIDDPDLAGTPLRIQFKFGDCWLFEYVMGDTLRWGGNDHGRPGIRHAAVYGSEAAQHGRRKYVIHVHSDVIAACEPMDDEWRSAFSSIEEEYIVVEE